MSNAAGLITDMQIDSSTITLPADLDLTLDPGGLRNTEAMQNNDGSKTRKVGIKGGTVTGITARLTKSRAIHDFVQLIIKSVTEDLPFIFTLANGDKYTGPVFIVISDDFWTNQEGSGKFELHAVNGNFDLVG